ncbi:MAG: hypothetical protein LC798_08470 [Chloroflexi bacterium]|nr:hypothetical protein [Chloroflexota bacterium]
MRTQTRLVWPAMVGLSLLLPACFPPFGPFGPVFPFPPMDGESELAVENATDENWVLRVVADSFPMDFAVSAGETGTLALFGGTPTSVALLDTDCQPIDELEWTDASQAVRIEPEAQLAAIDTPVIEDGETFVEYWECSGGFGPAPTAGDAVPGATGTIFLTGGEGGAWQIDPGTADLGQIGATTAASQDVEHELSPDGARIAFTRYAADGPSSSLFVADADGSRERLIVENAGTPTWSPDGSRLAYLSLDPFAGGPTISVIDLSGGKPIELAEDASTPRWSPDGQRIAFISVDMAGLNEPVAPPSELRIVNADGSGPETLAEANPFADRPAWSPDGTRIAFTGGSETEGTIDVADLDSGEVATVAEAGSASLTEPAWSPDGERIAFAISSFTLFSSEAAIGVVSTTGGEVERIGALEDAFVASPAWSPDGAWLAAVRSAGMEMTSDLILIELASGDETVLASGVLSVSSWRGPS